MRQYACSPVVPSDKAHFYQKVNQMPTLKRSVAAVQEVIPANVPLIGLDLARQALAKPENIATKRSAPRSKKGRVIAVGNRDFNAIGTETADLFLLCKADAKAARDEVNQTERVTIGMVWLAAAMQADDAEQAQVIAEAFKVECERKGHKRAKVDASEFKAFMMAYQKNGAAVIGALQDAPDYRSAMQNIRAIRDAGKPESEKRKGGSGKRKPSDRTMETVIEAIGRMDVVQLSKVWKAGLSRAKALRSQGEKFEMFKS